MTQFFSIENKALEQELNRLVSINNLAIDDGFLIRDFCDIQDCHNDHFIILLSLMLSEMNNGSLCLKLDRDSLSTLLDKLQLASYQAEIDRLLLAISNDEWSKVMSREQDAYFPMIIKELFNFAQQFRTT